MLYKFIHGFLITANVYVLSLALMGKLTLYIHPRYVLFTVIMTAVGLALSILAFFSTNAKMSLKSFVAFLPIIGLVAVGLLLPASSLSSFSAGQRSGGNLSENVVTRGENSVDLYGNNSGSLELIDWARLIGRNTDPKYYSGREVNVSGFVYDSGNPDSFQIARFVVSCCAIDAQPTGIDVYYPDWKSKFEQDQWLEISGEIKQFDLAGKSTLALDPETTTEIPEPENPYAN